MSWPSLLYNARVVINDALIMNDDGRDLDSKDLNDINNMYSCNKIDVFEC